MTDAQTLAKAPASMRGPSLETIGMTKNFGRFTALDDMCLTRRLSPGGSGDLLSATLFLDALEERPSQPCRP